MSIGDEYANITINIKNSSYIIGNEMKCTTKLEDHVSASIRENAIMLVNACIYIYGMTVQSSMMVIYDTFHIQR